MEGKEEVKEGRKEGRESDRVFTGILLSIVYHIRLLSLGLYLRTLHIQINVPQSVVWELLEMGN